MTGLMLGETISRCLGAAGDTDRGLGIVDRHLNEDWSTYAQLDERAAQIAAVLGEYIDVGDRVCLVGPTSLELLAGLFGAWYAGAVPSVLPLPRRISAAESFLEQIAARLERLGAGVLLCAGASFEGAIAGSAVRPVRIADIGFELTSRIERTGLFDAIATPGRIERSGIVAYAAAGMTPISAFPFRNSSAHRDGIV